MQKILAAAMLAGETGMAESMVGIIMPGNSRLDQVILKKQTNTKHKNKKKQKNTKKKKMAESMVGIIMPGNSRLDQVI